MRDVRPSLPPDQGQLEVVQDLAGHLIAQRSHRGQDPCGPDDPGDAAGLHSEIPGLFGKPAQLRLGQEPQEGFRTFAVHPPSVPPGRSVRGFAHYRSWTV